MTCYRSPITGHRSRIASLTLPRRRFPDNAQVRREVVRGILRLVLGFGEHGGEASSVKFCHRIGLDYVSCSPFRVPIARLAVAQAVLEEGKT